MDARGNTLVPVDTEQVEAIIGDLIDSGVESLTVSLINSYVDGRHEQEIADIVERLHPGFPVTISSAVLPGVPRVRAHADGVHELLRAPAGGVLRRPPAVLAATISASRPRSTSCAPTRA